MLSNNYNDYDNDHDHGKDFLLKIELRLFFIYYSNYFVMLHNQRTHRLPMFVGW